MRPHFSSHPLTPTAASLPLPHAERPVGHTPIPGSLALARASPSPQPELPLSLQVPRLQRPFALHARSGPATPSDALDESSDADSESYAAHQLW